MNFGAVVIPARYQSARFPGKPLVDINGISMLQHVYKNAARLLAKIMFMLQLMMCVSPRLLNILMDR